MSRGAIAVLGAAALATVAFFLLVPPIAQDPLYHDFADTRSFFGISNFWNVSSNLILLVVGLWGLSTVFRQSADICVAGLEPAYVVFFAGIFLTALGSAYYHLQPADEPLVWDRLPMTVGLAGLFSMILGEFVSARLGRAILIPLLITGALSVEYWAYTEVRGIGDLRPYAAFQFLPIMLMPLALFFARAHFGDARYYWIMLALYLLARIAEHFDESIYAAGKLISGHSLKHLLAGCAAATVLLALQERTATADATR